MTGSPPPNDPRIVTGSDSEPIGHSGGTRRTFLAAAAATGAALTIGGTALASQQDDAATVTFDDQRTDGTSVTVASAALPDGGFVTIHNSILVDSKGDIVRERRRFLESVVGVSAALDAGDHRDIAVDLFTGVPGREFEQEALREDQTLIAMPHFDTDGDGQYDFVCSEGEKDGPYTRDGEAVVDDANVTVDGG